MVMPSDRHMHILNKFEKASQFSLLGTEKLLFPTMSGAIQPGTW